jgi:hypothetical protein
MVQRRQGTPINPRQNRDRRDFGEARQQGMVRVSASAQGDRGFHFRAFDWLGLG